MSPLLPSKPFTMAVAVGGVPTSQYGTSPYNNFEGSSVQQDGLQPLSVDGNGQLQVGGNWQKPTGGSVPATAVLVGGYYAGGPRFLPLNLDSSGNIIVSSIVGSPTVTQGTQGTAAEGWFVELTDGTNVLGTSGHPLYVQDAILEASVALSGASITGLQYQAVAGSDGTFLRPMLTSSTGQIHVIVDSGGGTNLSVGPTGSPVPADATLIGGLDPVGGVNLYAAGVDTDNRLYVIDQAVQQAVKNTQEADTSGSGQPIDIVGGWQPSASAFYALQLNAEGELLVSSSGAASGATAIAGTLGSRNPALLATPGGLLRVQVDELPELDIDFPDPSEYIDQDLHRAIAQPRFPTPPNALQITTSMTPLALPSSPTISINQPLWGEPGNTSLLGLPHGAFYSSSLSPNATAPVSMPMVAQGAGQCVVVTVYNLSSAQWTNSCALRVRNNSNGITTNWQITALLAPSSSGAVQVGAMTFYFNVPVSANDNLCIDIYAASTLAGFAVAATLAPMPVLVQLRSDGRSLPLNTLLAAYSVANATVIAAVAGFRVMIGQIVPPGQYSTAGAIISNLTGTIAGTASVLVGPAGAAANVAPTVAPVPFAAGLLLDNDTAVTSVEGSAPTNGYGGSVSYDLVPA